MEPEAATKLEGIVRSVMDLAKSVNPSQEKVDANGWPIGYWEKFSGCLADEEWDIPDDPPPEPHPY